jgi:predicted alpha/beta hydrolase family esterase
MKRVIMVHGWYGHPTDGWWPWLKAELEKLGFTVTAPQLPNEKSPQINEWVSALADTIKQLDDDTYLVGHSLGCITILRYLESIKAEQIQAGGSVLVAGFTKDLDFVGYNGALNNFFQKTIDWQTIKAHCKDFTVISSDNDPTVRSDNHQRLIENLFAKGIWEHNKKHMTGDDDIFELYSVLTAIREFANK